MGGNMSRKTIAFILSLLGCFVAALPTFAQRPTPAVRPQAQDSHEATADLIEEEEPDPSDLEVYLATAMQPAPGAPAMSTRGSAAAPTRSSARPAMNRLASAPDMFGDFFMSGGNLNFARNNNGVPGEQSFGSFTVPGAGGSRRVKIAENNKAMPTDRLIFSYNHFENALQFSSNTLGNPGAAVRQTSPIDRCTIGIEKTFLDGEYSCEVRMPFVSQFDFQTPAIVGNGGQIGNLAVILKKLLVEDEDFAVVVGMGIDIPTGSDFLLDDVGSNPAQPTRFNFHNDSLHLLPYTGFLFAGDDRPYFINGFMQVDVATAGNRIEAGRVNGPSRILGTFNEQNLLFLDLGTGYWLHRDDTGTNPLTSLATLLEFHYTTSLQDTDVVNATVFGRPINYRNNFNRFDIVNITTGVQARLWDNTSVRVAGVFPLGSRDDQRFFDSEVQVQINRQF